MADERVNVEIVLVNNVPEEMVTITKREYESLKEDSDWLRRLENAGLDIWPGDDSAREIQRGEDG